jgi:hypothetical protein
MRDDFLLQSSATLALARIRLVTSDLDSCRKLLELIQLWHDVGGVVNTLELHAVQALYHALRGNVAECQRHVNEVYDELLIAEPTFSRMFLLFQFISASLVWLVAMSHSEVTLDTKELRTKLKRLMPSFKRVADGVPCSVPSYHIWNGMHHVVENNISHALHHFDAALNAAKQLGMIHQYAMATYLHGKIFSRPKDCERAKQLMPRLALPDYSRLVPSVSTHTLSSVSAAATKTKTTTASSMSTSTTTSSSSASSSSPSTNSAPSKRFGSFRRRRADSTRT